MDNLIAELRIFSTRNIPDYGWLVCDGKTYPIARYQSLFSLIGTQFGGDGKSSFAVPDLRGRLPMGSQRNFYKQGVPGGASATTLIANNLPPHTHTVNVISADGGTDGSPQNTFFGKPTASTGKYYTDGTGGNLVAMDSNMTGMTGNSLPVSNIQPILGLMFAIAYDGIYPSQA